MRRGTMTTSHARQTPHRWQWQKSGAQAINSNAPSCNFKTGMNVLVQVWFVRNKLLSLSPCIMYHRVSDQCKSRRCNANLLRLMRRTMHGQREVRLGPPAFVSLRYFLISSQFPLFCICLLYAKQVSTLQRL